MHPRKMRRRQAMTPTTATRTIMEAEEAYRQGREAGGESSSGVRHTTPEQSRFTSTSELHDSDVFTPGFMSNLGLTPSGKQEATPKGAPSPFMLSAPRKGPYPNYRSQTPQYTRMGHGQKTSSFSTPGLSPIPGLNSQQGLPNFASGSGKIPSSSATPPASPQSGRPSTPEYDSLSQSASSALGPLTDDDHQYLRKLAIKNHFKQINKAASNVANPIVPPGAGPPGVSTAVPPGAGGGGGAPAGGGGGAPPAVGVGAADEPSSTFMHGEAPNPAGVEGGFKIPKNKEPIGGMEASGVVGGGKPDEARRGEGEYVPPAYGDGSAFAEKAREPDSDRVDPITPASGSKQTPETANSLVGADKILESAQKQPQEKVLGNAEERANMGKGAFSGYEFAGPYDYPTFPSGRRDTQLTSLGAWRSKTGEHSASLWSSRMTAKGTPAKRDKYYKWSTKGGGNWSKLNSVNAMRVMTKNSARKNGARWMDRPNPGQELTHLMSSTLKRKMEDIQMGKAGNERMNKRKKGQDPAAGKAACGGGGHQVQM